MKFVDKWCKVPIYVLFFTLSTKKTRTLLVALSLSCLEMSFIVKGAGAVILLFCLEYKTSAICHNVNTQKVKIARRDRPYILASNRCETFENLLHIDIAPLRGFTSGFTTVNGKAHWGVLCQWFYTQKIERWFLSVSGAHDSVRFSSKPWIFTHWDSSFFFRPLKWSVVPK